MSKYTAYSGSEFEIEWYFNNSGRSQPLEYYRKLAENRQNNLLTLMKAMGERGRIRNTEKFRNEGDKIYAFKPQPDRFFCCFAAGRKIIITNAFKKGQTLKQEKRKALAYRKDYLERVKRGEYYEKN